LSGSADHSEQNNSLTGCRHARAPARERNGIGISRGIMFHHRSSAFGPSVTAIQRHLGAVEEELEKIGRIAGRRTSIAATAAGDQLGDAISTMLGDMIERFRQSRQSAGDTAARFGSRALKLGTSYGNDALERVASEVEGRPAVALGLALGIGILIGAAVLGGMNAGKPRQRRR
jgi:hypothetical protein